MKWGSRFVSEKRHLVLVIILIAAISVGALAGWTVLANQENGRLERLQTANERLVIEILSKTQNSNLMGAVAVLGLIDPYVKQEALGQIEANNSEVLPALETVGRAYMADGVFVVPDNGIIASSWDSTGKSSTSLDVNFRPYYKTAKKGYENIYAAVSIARGDRSLYFSAPIYSGTLKKSGSIGAVVARTNLVAIDQLLEGKSDIVLVISPQGVVFAASDKGYIGQLTGVLTPERLKAIRELKQYGKMFDEDVADMVAVPVIRGVYHLSGKRLAVATAEIEWNDPNGDWQLVMIENLNRSISLFDGIVVGVGVLLGTVIVGLMICNIMRGQHRQREANQKLQNYARLQEASAAYKMQLAQTSVQLQGSKNVEALLQLFFKESHTIFGTLQGVVYLCDENDDTQMRLSGTYACDSLPPGTLEMGEGLLGQCALERRTMMMKAGADGLGMIRSGLGEHLPECVYLAPIVLNETLLGVIEVALLRELTALELDALNELIAMMAINVEIVGRSSHAQAYVVAMEAAQQVNSEQLTFQQALIDTIPYPIFYKDDQTRFLGVNQSYEAHFGVKREDMIGKRVVELSREHISERDALAFQLEAEAIIAGAESTTREIQLTFSDGNCHDVLYCVAGFSKPDGTPAGLVGTCIDISEIKQVKSDLKRLMDAENLNQMVKERERIVVRSRESHHGLEALSDLLNDFCNALGVAVAIIDIEGQVLMASNWQRVCSDFHRKNETSCTLCVESDTEMAVKLDQGAEYTIYKCKNGMADAGAPIMVDGKHVANVFVGQFHTQKPSTKFFQAQAKKYGYDEASYLEAVSNAAVIEKRRIPAILNFLTDFAMMLLEQTSKETQS